MFTRNVPKPVRFGLFLYAFLKKDAEMHKDAKFFYENLLEFINKYVIIK